MIEEIWRPVVGYEGWYSVSNLGKIRRDRINSYTSGGIMKTRIIIDKGYEQVNLCRDGVRQEFKVHKLVAAAFIGPRPNKYQINHKNGIKTDNSADNLEYLTASENQLHSVKHGLFQDSSGSRNPMAKTNEETVLKIRSEFDGNNRRESAKNLSEKYGIRRADIYRIINRERWKHI